MSTHTRTDSGHRRPRRTHRSLATGVAGATALSTLLVLPGTASPQDLVTGLDNGNGSAGSAVHSAVPPSAWLADGTATFSYDRQHRTARFRSCDIDTGRIAATPRAESEPVLRGTADNGGTRYTFTLPTNGQAHGHVRDSEGQVLTGPVNRPLSTYPALDWHELRTELEAAIAESGTRAAVAVQDLRDPARGQLVIGSTEPFRSASTIKVSILAELLHQVECGTTSLEDEIVVTEDDVVGGSGQLRYEDFPQSIPISRLAELMIVVSDNTATNVLIDHVGFDNVNAMFDIQNLDKMWLGRKMMHPADPELRQENYIDAEQMVAHLAAIWDARFLSEESRDVLLEHMSNVATKFRGGLPSDAPVANKPGGLASGVSNDAGFFLVPSKEIAFAVLTDGPRTSGDETVRRVGQILSNAITEPEEPPRNGRSFSTDFSGDEVGQQPSSWSTLWRDGNWTIADDPRRLHLDGTTSSRQALVWDEVGHIDGDVEAYGRVRGQDHMTLFHLGLHNSGTAGNENAYILRARTEHAPTATANHLQLGRYSNGTFTTLASTPMPFTVAEGTWYHVLVQREGGVLRGKMWPEGHSEPTDWQVVAHDGLLSGGRVGPSSCCSSLVMDWSAIGVGTGGEPAPRP